MTAVLSSVLVSALPTSFGGGNQSVDSVLALLKTMAASTNAMSTPAAGGTLTVDGQSVGSYDYVIKHGNQVVSSFNAGDWFTSTQDSSSAIIVVKGNLTIDAAVIFTPAVRKLFKALYVTGSLTVNGELGMTARGANHSASGSNIAAVDIRLANGTYDGVSNPYIPADGGGGGPPVSAVNADGNTKVGIAGADGSDGRTGGGGSGGARNTSGTGTSGAGSAGTCFTGGTGGGAVRRNSNGTAASGTANGGPGGNGNGNDGTGAGGAAGNPGGSGQFGGASAGESGTGGVLIVFVGGALLGTGKIEAKGKDGGAGAAGGGASGGGSITVICGSDESSINLSAEGGVGKGTVVGGDGGDGSVRVLAAAA